MDAHEFFKTSEFKSLPWYTRFRLRATVAFFETIGNI